MAEAPHTIVATERSWARRVLALAALCAIAAAVFAARAWPFSPGTALLIAVSAATFAIVVRHILRDEVSVGLIPIAFCGVWPAALAACNAGGGPAAFALAIAGCCVFCFMLAWFSRMALACRPMRDVAEMGTAVVLGCAVKDGMPSATLQLRLDAAVALWQRHPRMALIVTGGVSDPGEPSEAEVMARHLAAAGIPPEQIVPEDRALNTEENLANARALIEGLGLPGPIWLVTSDYHMLRSARIARAAGLETIPCAARTPLSTRLLQWSREVLVICLGT